MGMAMWDSCPKPPRGAIGRPKPPKCARRLLEETIEQLYARPKQQKAREVFFAYQRICLEQCVQPLSERTFYRSVKMRAVQL